MELISGRVVEFQVGMEFWARWAHRALWHASLWHMHEVRNFDFHYFVLLGEKTEANKLMKSLKIF